MQVQIKVKIKKIFHIIKLVYKINYKTIDNQLNQLKNFKMSNHKLILYILIK